MDDLTRSLLTVATRPEQLAALYRTLRQFCHTFRNRLNVLKLSVYLARRGAPPELRGALAELERRYQAIEEFVDRLQSFCRPSQLAPIRAGLGQLLEEHRPGWAERLAARGIALEWHPPRGDADGDFDTIQLGHALDGFVAWRAVRAPTGATARVRWGVQGGELHLDWDERTDPHDRHAVSRRPPAPSPSSLAMALLLRVVHAHGGGADVVEGPCFGVAVRLPVRSTPARAEVPDRTPGLLRSSPGPGPEPLRPRSGPAVPTLPDCAGLLRSEGAGLT